MALDTVTVTGADDSVSPHDLVKLSEEFPFVEWGILFSRSSQGRPRYPTKEWLAKLRDATLLDDLLKISIHVCGSWVRYICCGNWSPLYEDSGHTVGICRRVQLNFHAYQHFLTPDFSPTARIQSEYLDCQLIFQCDGVNDHLVSNAYDDGINAVPLYDKSGGAGIVPGEWPSAMKGIYSGYAGGLGPDNLASEIPKIEEAAGGEKFWIDMETKVRSKDNRQFDLGKVRECLEISSTFIRNGDTR